MKQICRVCFHHCALEEGQTGLCGARRCVDGTVQGISYGQLTAIALDPIEKKPLAEFHPGSSILSVGSYGCNLCCPFCQNHEIAHPCERIDAQYMSPEELCALACRYRERGNIGVAYTYNEPLTFWEYVRDTGKLVHENGMYNVLVSNGTAEPEIVEKILPYIDAMNIDLKSFRSETYEKTLGGSLEVTKAFITQSLDACHVELTTLIVPGMNDSDQEMEEMSAWIASLMGGRGIDIPYHISRFFPRYQMENAAPTDMDKLMHLAEIARKHLHHVYMGNC